MLRLNDEAMLKDVREAVLKAHRIAMLMLYKFCPYGQHMWP